MFARSSCHGSRGRLGFSCPTKFTFADNRVPQSSPLRDGTVLMRPQNPPARLLLLGASSSCETIAAGYTEREPFPHGVYRKGSAGGCCISGTCSGGERIELRCS
jgi:hypothetical protein